MTNTGRRAQNYARAKALHDLGLPQREIAERTGLSPSYVSKLLHDPGGARDRERKALYAGVCVDCDGPTDGSNGPAHTPERCAACRAEYQHANAKWTRETVLAALRWFTELHGQPPSASDLNPSVLRGRKVTPERVAQAQERFASGDWPPVKTVIRKFGSWNAAIRAAGYEPARGPKRARVAASKEGY